MLPFIVLGEKLLHIGHLLSVAEKLPEDQLVLALVLDNALTSEPLIGLLHHAGVFHRIWHVYREWGLHHLASPVGMQHGLTDTCT